MTTPSLDPTDNGPLEAALRQLGTTPDPKLRDEQIAVALGHIAKLLRRHDLLDVGREPLLVDREGGGIHLARGRDLEATQLHDPVARGVGPERDVEFGDASRADFSRPHIARQAGVERLHLDRARRHLRQAEITLGVGERRESGAFDRNTGALDILGIALVEHAALQGAGVFRGRQPLGLGRGCGESEPRG